MSDHAVGRLAARIKALAAVIRQLESRTGLAGADRLGLQVCAEVLEEAHQVLGDRGGKLTPEQTAHLQAPGQQLVATGDELPHSATPAQVASWWRALEPAARARAFARAVHELPHR